MNIDVSLLDWPSDGNGSMAVILSGKDQQQRVISSYLLRTMLFAWHQPSYYGTMIEEVRTGEGPAIQVPLEWLWDLLFIESSMNMVQIKFDEEMNQVRMNWIQMLEEVQNNRFQPDIAYWAAGYSIFGKHAIWMRVVMKQQRAFLEPSEQAVTERLLTLERMPVDERMLISDSLGLEGMRSIIDSDEGEHVIRVVAHDPNGWLYRIETDSPLRAQLIRIICRTWKWQDEDHLMIPFELERLFMKETFKQIALFGFRLVRNHLETGTEPVTWTVEASVRTKSTPEQFHDLKMSQWLDWEWTILLNGIEWPRDAWKEWLEEPRGWIRVSDRLFSLTDTQITDLKRLLSSFLAPGPKTVSDWLKAKLESNDQSNPLRRSVEWRNEELLERWYRQVTKPLTEDVDGFEPPETFHGVLRPYQEAGCRWLSRMREMKLGALLADEMGLGKTVQVIAHLLRLKLAPTGRPSLLICPTTVLGNWQKELQKFAPILNVIVHYGAQRDRSDTFNDEIMSVDLVMTTYGTAQLDAELLHTVQWDTMILDEAQQIKNPFTKQTRSIRNMKHDHAIAMTGTPIENRVVELWSIMDVLNSGYLGHYRSFAKDWRKADDMQMRALRAWVHPFLLRRRKADPDVALSLPDKTIIPEYVPLSLEQAAAYEKTVQNCLTRVRETTGMIRRGLVLSTLTKLKQICNYVDDVRPSSPKIDRVVELVEAIREDGEAVLLFTQFVQTGTLLQQRLSKRFGEPVLFLHGSLTRKQRDELVNSFQSGEPNAPKLFVLSLRAGGYGLNLTAANHVIHVDRWWNPAVEQQASDRVHRIGQSRNVRIYRMITMGTLEERIDELLEEKEWLAERVLESTGEGWLVDQPIELLEKIFRLDEKRATFAGADSFIQSSRTGRES